MSLSPEERAEKIMNKLADWDWEDFKPGIKALIASEINDAVRAAVEEVKDKIRSEGIGRYELAKAKAEAYEDAAKIAEGDCLPKCDSIAHEELCPVVNPAKAIRARAREVVGNGKRDGL